MFSRDVSLGKAGVEARGNLALGLQIQTQGFA